MTGKEMSVRVFDFQPSGQVGQFFIRLISVKQMEAADDSLYRVRTGSKYIIQSAMGTTRKQEPFRV